MFLTHQEYNKIHSLIHREFYRINIQDFDIAIPSYQELVGLEGQIFSFVVSSDKKIIKPHKYLKLENYLFHGHFENDNGLTKVTFFLRPLC